MPKAKPALGKKTTEAQKVKNPMKVKDGGKSSPPRKSTKGAKP